MMVAQNKHKALSPRAKGILQGIAIVPAGIGAMFAIDIFYEALGAGMMAGLYSTLTIISLVSVVDGGSVTRKNRTIEHVAGPGRVKRVL